MRTRNQERSTSTASLAASGVGYWPLRRVVMQRVAVPKASPSPLPEVAAYLEPFAALFRRAESRGGLERYVTGLLTDLPRKNCQAIAAAVAGTSTERLQHLLTDADWDPAALDEARVRGLVGAS